MAAPAGYWFVTILDFGADADAQAKYAQFDKDLAAKGAEAGFEVVFAGNASASYEMAVVQFNNQKYVTLVKFPGGVDKAKEFFTSNEWYQSQLKELGVNEKILRDVRILEGPADLFEPGKAWWCAKIYDVVDSDKMMTYIQASLGQSEAEGYRMTLDSGEEAVGRLAIKHITPSSEVYEHGKTLLPEKGSGKVFFQPEFTTDMGMCAFLDIGPHDVGAKICETVDYKNTKLKSFGAEYTTEEDYQDKNRQFVAEVFKRDLRIVPVGAAA